MKKQNDQDKFVNGPDEKNTFIEVVLQHIPMGIVVNKINDGKALVVNEYFSEICGWPADDLTNLESFFRKVCPDEGYRSEIMVR